jgi:glycosyltransferase involved in cell wall biosynthesis
MHAANGVIRSRLCWWALIHTLHELVRLGYDAQLLMIGERVGASDPTNFAYLQEVEALIAQLDLTARVQWTGRLSDRAVSQALHLLDVLFMPYSDGISLRRGTLMAGLAHGCAIVTTAPVYPLPELVDGRDLLYVPPEDPQRAASVIASLANQPQLHQGLQRSARRQSNQFTWSTIATHHVQAYQTQQHHLATDVSNHE